MIVYLTWTDFKNNIEFKNHVQYQDRNTYYYITYDDEFETSILKDDGNDQDDFETNYKSFANVPHPHRVVTNLEIGDKILKVVSSKATVDQNGLATILIPIPGVYANGDCRYIESGQGWFDQKHLDDRVIEIELIDVDNILGGGANALVVAYCDDEIDPEYEGAYIPYHTGVFEIHTVSGLGRLPAELYLKIEAQKGGQNPSGTFYCNIIWAK